MSRSHIIMAMVSLLAAGCIAPPSAVPTTDVGVSPDASDQPDASYASDGPNTTSDDSAADAGCRPTVWRTPVAFTDTSDASVSATLPVPMRLESNADLTAVAKDGHVAWFATADGNPVPHEIVSANLTGGDLEAWFEWFPGEPLYLHVAPADQRATSPAMWQDYAGVWHFSTTPIMQIPDSSPNANTATAPNGGALGPGYFGVGIELSGTQHMAVPDDESLRIDEYSIAMWVRFGDPLASSALVSKVLKTGTTPRKSYGYLVRENGIMAAFGTPTDSGTYSTFANADQDPPVVSNEWQHLMYTRSRDVGVNLFLNGQLVHEQAFNQALAFDDGDLLIGADFNGSIYRQLRGRIDEVMIEVGQRPPNDVALIYRAQHDPQFVRISAFEPVDGDCP